MHETFKTDANGQFNFPDKLKYGIYYLEEIHAPEGYLKGGLLKFEVTEGATWENPLIIEYADENAMGTITIQKTDAETDAVLGGAVFEIVAAEDIVTPDGTVRLTKGAVADTVTTDKNGTATSKSLYLGKYKVKEKQQPQGYILSKKTYETELVYKDQNTALVTAQVNATNTPTRPELYKTDADTKEPLEGVQYKVWNKEMQADDSVDPEMAAEQICTTDKEGKISISYLAPGTYCFQEVKALPGYAVDDKIYEITIDADGRIDGKEVGEIHATNKHVEIVKTTAIDKATETHEAVPNKTTTFVDKVEYKGLQVSKEYVLKGKLMDKATGKPLLIDEKEVTAEKTFIPEKADGEVTVEFTFDSSALLGKSVVVFESLYDEGIEAAVHADIEDKGQTVEFPKPEIGTTALDKATGTHKAVPDKKTTFVDTVKYKNLVVGQKYTVKGVLMDKATGKPLQIDGKEVTAEKTFIPEKADGEIKVEFRFDSSALIGKTTVTFEKIYVNGMEVAAHEDLEDEGQTVEFPKPEIGTTALDKATGTHEAVPNQKTTIVDTVKYKGLVAGQKYMVKGVLMDKEAGKPLMIDEKEVTAEKTFTAEKADGEVKVEFTFDSSALLGKTTVVFEKVYVNGIKVAAHEELEDEGQTVTFPKPEIGTTAKDKESGTQEGTAKKEVTIVDTVQYKGLVPGVEYTMRGVLMDKAAGKELEIEGKTVTSEKKFTPEKSEGSVDMEFTFDASGLKNQAVVVFEKVYVDGIEVAAHEDINDEGQTVTFKKIPKTLKVEEPKREVIKTGDEAVFYIFIGLWFVSGMVIAIMVYWRKRKK